MEGESYRVGCKWMGRALPTFRRGVDFFKKGLVKMDQIGEILAPFDIESPFCDNCRNENESGVCIDQYELQNTMRGTEMNMALSRVRR